MTPEEYLYLSSQAGILVGFLFVLALFMSTN